MSEIIITIKDGKEVIFYNIDDTEAIEFIYEITEVHDNGKQ